MKTAINKISSMAPTLRGLLRMLVLAVFLGIAPAVTAADVITFTGGNTTNVYDKMNSPAIYFTSPASKNGASKLLLKSVQLYTFLDSSTGSAANLQGQTVYLGVSTSRPATNPGGSTGAAHTAESGISIIGFSEGVMYNSEGYTNFVFQDGLEIDPETEYTFYLTRSNSATTSFTYYNFRFRVWQQTSNTEIHYMGQENFLQWMPFYIITLNDKEEETTTSIPNPAMTEDEIKEDVSSSGSAGNTTQTYLKGFGFTTPNGAGVSSYQADAIQVYIPYNRTYTRGKTYYLVIAKSNIGTGSIAADEIIAVSKATQFGTSTASGYKTFSFNSTLKFRPNTTYYAYFTQANPGSGTCTPSYCYVQVYSKTYQPTVIRSSSANGTYAPTSSYWPVFQMTLTKVMAADPYADGELQTLWSSYHSEHPWRIPALARTQRGHLVALGGWLVCNTDIGHGECHIASKTSIDNGVTWSRAGAAVATGSGISGAYDCGYGDAAVVADRESDRILVMCASGNVVYTNSTRTSPIRVARIYGTDSPSGNITWEAPTDVTSDIYAINTNMQGTFFASGRIMQSRVVKVGEYYRLYSALLYKYNSSTHRNIVVYSDDFGATWKQLGTTDAISADANEAKVDELPNGDILISSRKDKGRYFNLFTFTNLQTAEGSWGTRQTLSLGNGQSCNGELLLVNVRKSDQTNCILALQSMPSAAQTTNYPRQKVRIYWREVNSAADLNTIANWTSGWSPTQSYQVSCSGSAYSTMIVTADNKIGFMLENNYYNSQSNYAYCDLQYVNLPISTITNGAYTDILSEFVLPYRQSYATSIAPNKTDMRFDKVTLVRDDMNDTERYYTLCLPFALTADEASACGLTAIETLNEYIPDNTIRFTDVDGGIEAFQPYAVQSGNTSGITFSGRNILVEKDIVAAGEKTVGEASFKGNLAEGFQFSENGTVNAYGYSATSGKFVKAGTSATLRPYCAYVVLPNSQSHIKTLNTDFASDDDVTPTGIEQMTVTPVPSTTTMYNLAGQRVQQGYKGVVIIDGKKYLMK